MTRGLVHNVQVAVRSVVTRVLYALKTFLTFPLTIKERGGWPWYIFAVVHAFLLVPLPFKLYNAVRPAHVFGMFKTDLDLTYVPNYETDGGALEALTAADEARVRDTMNRYSAYCQTLDGVRAEFCEHMQNRELLSAYNDFRKGRAKHCEGQWKEERNFEMFYTNTDEAGYHDLNPDPSSPLYDVTFQVFTPTLRGPYEEDAGLGDHARPPPKDFMKTDHEYVKSTCEFDSKSSGGRWYVSRVGPFTDRTKGSWQWLWYHVFADVARAASFSPLLFFDAGMDRSSARRPSLVGRRVRAPRVDRLVPDGDVQLAHGREWQHAREPARPHAPLPHVEGQPAPPDVALVRLPGL